MGEQSKTVEALEAVVAAYGRMTRDAFGPLPRLPSPLGAALESARAAMAARKAGHEMIMRWVEEEAGGTPALRQTCSCGWTLETPGTSSNPGRVAGRHLREAAVKTLAAGGPAWWEMPEALGNA